MNKLNFKSQSQQNAAVLTRHQLKNVMGGLDLGTTCSTTCREGNPAEVLDCTGLCIAMPDQYAECMSPSKKVTCKDVNPPK